jgi:hypothetical protein
MLAASSLTFYHTQAKIVNEGLLAPFTTFANTLSQWSAYYWGSNGTALDAGHCCVWWFKTWADWGGLLGRTNTQGKMQRMFRLAQVAISYLRIRCVGCDLAVIHC